MYNKTINNGGRINTSIIQIDCRSGKTKSRLYFRNLKHEVKHINVSFHQCNSYKIGDTITVFINEENDWYEIDPSTLIR